MDEVTAKEAKLTIKPKKVAGKKLDKKIEAVKLRKAGKSNTEIAKILGVSAPYVSILLKKKKAGAGASLLGPAIQREVKAALDAFRSDDLPGIIEKHVRALLK